MAVASSTCMPAIAALTASVNEPGKSAHSESGKSSHAFRKSALIGEVHAIGGKAAHFGKSTHVGRPHTQGSPATHRGDPRKFGELHACGEVSAFLG